MATSRPPSGGSTPVARLGFDFSALRAAPGVAREAGRATARELQNAFKIVQNEQRITLAQAQQAVAAVRAQQTQITSIARAESSQRISAARAEAAERSQQARALASAQIEAERRLTAQFRSELRTREQAARAAQRATSMGGGSFLRGAAGAALGSMGGPVGAIAGSLAGGGTAGVATAVGVGLVQAGRSAVEADATATAYRRQREAAGNLAGSQDRLNSLMETYNRATGGAVDKATALADVTNLMAQRFADSSQQLDTFLRGVRGASVATGRPQEFIIERAQFEMLNQTGQRLNEIGLSMAEVRQRADELRASNASLTQEQAYAQAVVDSLNKKFGDLSRSAVAQATGAEKAAKAWKDARLELGELARGPVNFGGNLLTAWLEQQIALTQQWQRGIQGVGEMFGLLSPLPGPGNLRSANYSNRTIGAAPSSMLSPDQKTLVNQRYQSLGDVDRGQREAIRDAAIQGNAQRRSIEENYQKSTLREQQDFARARVNAEAKLGMSILDVHQDSARQRSKWEADSERTIAKARQDTAKRLADLDEDFKKDQKRREKDFRDDMLSAAGRLDAIALLELRKGRARELEDAREAHKEQRNDLKEQLVEREREERESLKLRIDEQRDNDRLRIEEMKAAFEDQKRQEDAERGIRLQRQAEDHQSQLDELTRQQAARIQQIKDQAQEQRTEIEEQFKLDMAAAGVRLKGVDEHLRALEKLATDSFDRTYKHFDNTSRGRTPVPVGGARPNVPGAEIPSFARGGLVERNGLAFVHTGEYVMPVPPIPPEASGSISNSRSITIGSLQPTIVIGDLGGRSNADIEAMIRNGVVEALEEIAGH